ncbi:hypothetical protein Bbelb_137270 [Branchiostoma belcheri]|nr:hypothetical protein Bbelb_137270 [Branchiostoma belcheri]
MANEFIIALAGSILSTPNTIGFAWRALCLVYWLLATMRSFWDDHDTKLGFVMTAVCLRELVAWPIPYFPYNGLAVVAIKFIHQILLCVLLFLVHSMSEKQMSRMSLRHRVCYALLVENCVAYNMTWNYAQTSTLLGALLVQDFGVGPDTVSTLLLVLLAICVLATVSVELVFLNKLRWTAAGHFPIQMWVYYLYQGSVLDGRMVWVLLVTNALLVIIKFTPEKCKYHRCVAERMEEDDSDENLLVEV